MQPLQVYRVTYRLKRCWVKYYLSCRWKPNTKLSGMCFFGSLPVWDLISSINHEYGHLRPSWDRPTQGNMRSWVLDLHTRFCFSLTHTNTHKHFVVMKKYQTTELRIHCFQGCVRFLSCTTKHISQCLNPFSFLPSLLHLSLNHSPKTLKIKPNNLINKKAEIDSLSPSHPSILMPDSYVSILQMTQIFTTMWQRILRVIHTHTEDKMSGYPTQMGDSRK